MSTWLVVGLGNPGPRYAAHRHNLGAIVVGELARRYAGGAGAPPRSSEPPITTTLADFKAHKARAHVVQVLVPPALPGAPGVSALLAVPAAYMNESGGPVKALLGFYSLPVDRLVVVHDELDLPAGTIRLKFGGGEGGHNGVRSVSAALGTRDYLRVRVGIGRPPGRMDPADFVLEDFASRERKEMPITVTDAADALEDLLRDGLEAAQQRWHSRG